MRFLLDESADARIRRSLHERGHDVSKIGREYPPGLADDDVLSIAYETGRILITSDLDFGELVFVQHQPHAGVILHRLGPSPALAMIEARLDDVLHDHARELDRFIVVTHERIRVRD